MFPYNFNNNMYMSSPVIDEKLKKSDCSLEELLDEEEIIQEIKNQNTKLMNFFDKNKVRALIDYIIREPDSDEHKRGHKYPFVASEILSCDVNKINDFFIQTDAELLLKERKDSNLSGTDSDMMLSADDHLNAFSNEDKTRNGKKEDKNDLVMEQEEKKEETTETPNEVSTHNFHNKSISDIVPHENLDELQTGFNNETLEKKNSIELLDYLLSFFDTEKPLNYVLVGYVSRYFNNLLNKYPHKIISYIYLERPEILLRLISHCTMKSIAEFLPKLFLIESYLNEKGLEKSKDSNNSNVFSSPLTMNIDLILSKRKGLLTSLFKSLSVDETDPEKVSNTSNVCIELIESKVILETVLADKEILCHLMNNLAKKTETNFESNYNWSEIANVMLNIVRFTSVENLKAPVYASHEDTVNNDFPAIENTPLAETVLDCLERVLLHFAPDESEPSLEGTFGGVYKPLGIKRLKLIELVYFFMAYFKNVSSVINRLLIRSKFLKYSIDYFFIYEWNNLYALAFENLFKSYLNNNLNHPEITRHIFGDLALLELLIEKGKTCTEGENDGFTFNSNRKINHGYYSILIELCHKINESADVHFRETYFTQAWENFTKDKVVFWRKLFDRRLCQPDAPNVGGIENQVFEEVKEKPENETDAESPLEHSEEEVKEDNNPFQRDEYFFNMGNENDDWYNPKKNEEHFTDEKALEDINSFEFVDESKEKHHYNRKLSTEELILKEQDIYNLKVDEIEDANYSDTSFWKGISHNVLNSKDLDKMMADLEL